MIRVALQGIRGFPLRAFLVGVSLVIAVTALISITAAASTIQATVEQRALLVGGPTKTFTIAGLAGEAGLRDASSVQQRLARFARTQNVVRDAEMQDLMVVSGRDGWQPSIHFVDSNLRGIHPYPVLSGQWISDQAWLAPRAVINEASAGISGLRLGDTVDLQSSTTTSTLHVIVVGIVNDGSDAPDLYIPLASATAFLAENAARVTVSLQVSANSASEKVVKSFLTGQDSLTATPHLWSVRRTDTVEKLAAELQATRLTFQTIAWLSLLGAVLSIANVGLSALKERASELSLRRALGASRVQLAAIVLLESQFVAIAAGIASVPLSFFAYPWIAAQFGAPFGVAPPPYSYISALSGVVFGMLAALVGSTPAALRAFHVPIANVMRE